MRKKLILFFAFLCIIPFISYSQKNIESRNITHGKIFMVDSKIIDCFNIFISKDSVEYYEKDLIIRHVFELNTVDKIQEYRGTWSNTGIWVGSLAGCALGVAVSLGTKETTTTYEGWGYYQETRIQLWPIYLCTALGAVVGYLIGNNAADWGTIYTKDLSILKNLDIQRNRNAGGLCVTFKMSF
jgi:hypothetical protein